MAPERRDRRVPAGGSGGCCGVAEYRGLLRLVWAQPAGERGNLRPDGSSEPATRRPGLRARRARRAVRMKSLRNAGAAVLPRASRAQADVAAGQAMGGSCCGIMG